VTVTRFVSYSPDDDGERPPYWSHLEFFDLKLRGRKVLRLYGVDKIHSVSIEQLDNEAASDYTKMLYDVMLHGFHREEKAHIFEVVATENNLKLTKKWSNIALHVVGHVIDAEIDLKEYKGDIPAWHPHPRVPRNSVKSLKNLPAEDTKTEVDLSWLDKKVAAHKEKQQEDPIAWLEAL